MIQEMLKQIKSKLITAAIESSDNDVSRFIIKEESVTNWTINLEEIHTLGDVTDLGMFEYEGDIVAITYFELGTLYYADDFDRIFNLWKDYQMYMIKEQIQRRFN